MSERYRVGNHQDRNLYRGNEYIGVMFSPADARLVSATLNGEQLEPAAKGDWLLWMHECGAVEMWSRGTSPDDGGCDACESGSPNAADWRPLYVR